MGFGLRSPLGMRLNLPWWTTKESFGYPPCPYRCYSGISVATWPVSLLAYRISGFHPEGTGSIPVRATMPYKDKAKRKEYARLWMAQRRLEFFVDKCCVICGSIEDLELDHKDPTQKVTHRIWSWSLKRRETELAKCQVLCKIHHIQKTKNTDSRYHQSSLHALNEEKVSEIRQMYLTGNYTQKELAQIYHVHLDTIGRAIRKRHWQ